MTNVADLAQDEARLLAGFRAGDYAAFHQLHARHAGRLMAFLQSHCGPPLDPQQLSQDVWLRAWRNRATFSGNLFRPWLFKIARHLMIDEWRRKRPDLAGEDFDPAAPEDCADERVDALRKCLEKLGSDFVSAVRALYVEELSTKQIAEREKIAAGTVSSRVSRGKELLRQCIEKSLS